MSHSCLIMGTQTVELNTHSILLYTELQTSNGHKQTFFYNIFTILLKERLQARVKCRRDKIIHQWHHTEVAWSCLELSRCLILHVSFELIEISVCLWHFNFLGEILTLCEIFLHPLLIYNFRSYLCDSNLLNLLILLV